jgi:hypothetical protein
MVNFDACTVCRRSLLPGDDTTETTIHCACLEGADPPKAGSLFMWFCPECGTPVTSLIRVAAIDVARLERAMLSFPGYFHPAAEGTEFRQFARSIAAAYEAES